MIWKIKNPKQAEIALDRSRLYDKQIREEVITDDSERAVSLTGTVRVVTYTRTVRDERGRPTGNAPVVLLYPENGYAYDAWALSIATGNFEPRP